MKIAERKEVTHVEVEEVITGRKCDVCGKEIEEYQDDDNYNYFVIHTWNNDWGYDSIDSHEYMDACCPECVMKFTEEYIREAFEDGFNSHDIEIRHVRRLSEGATES